MDLGLLFMVSCVKRNMQNMLSFMSRVGGALHYVHFFYFLSVINRLLDLNWATTLSDIGYRMLLCFLPEGFKLRLRLTLLYN